MATEKVKRKILLVDDDPSLLVNVGQFLSHEGYDVTTANSGEHALEALKAFTPNLIILDMSMPGMGGMGFLKMITDENGKPQYPVLVLTARAQMAEFFADVEVDGFLAKPTDPDDLLTEVDRIMFLRGAEVSFTAPVKPVEHISAGESKINVLVADQDIENTNLIRDELEDKGYNVIIENSGPVALQSAVSLLPNFIVLRADLEGTDGFALVSLMRMMPALADTPAVIYGAENASNLEVDDLTISVAGNKIEDIISAISRF